jgi:nitroimidazol reductase NimA-like FMN-containing flavoprotein (pyridoxamine 5'-phosphate oxidase superfamily)
LLVTSGNGIQASSGVRNINYAFLKYTTTAVPSEGSLQPDVVPVGFDFDGEYFYVGGINLLKSKKYKNVLKNNKVALVIDDLKMLIHGILGVLDFTVRLI